MIRHSIVAAGALSLGLGSAVMAQTSDMSSTVTKTFDEPGIVEAISPDEVTVQDSYGIEKYPVTKNLQFRLNGKDVDIDQLKPGMKVKANVTDQVTTHDVTITQVLDGTVTQIVPGGFVLLDRRNQYVSYDFTDPQGNDVRYIAPDGREAPLRDMKLGEHLKGTFVTRLPAQVIAERSVLLDSEPGTAVSALAPPRGAGQPESGNSSSR